MPAALRALGEQQAALIRALVAGGATPPGFDDATVRAAESALLRKRAGILARHNPMLAHAAGADFEQKFASWARGRPKISTDADIAAFAEYVGIRLSGTKSRFADRIRSFVRRMRP
ncbi:hypothetical protein [Nocardia cyriacigeorgica]|uniref:hypothetical protein n=1 Tax=Nocardia cyriacigeorgica TaxID=135487 RepID=UPI00158BD149|nr:hypothetical protein [Nocardia cyriacigeorgica]